MMGLLVVWMIFAVCTTSAVITKGRFRFSIELNTPPIHPRIDMKMNGRDDTTMTVRPSFKVSRVIASVTAACSIASLTPVSYGDFIIRKDTFFAGNSNMHHQ